MAISATHFHIIRLLHDAGQLPQGGGLLELGEANWYYPDIPGLDREIQTRVDSVPRAKWLLEKYRVLETEKPATYAFDIVKLLYGIYWAPSWVDSIDYDGTPNARQFDLNLALPGGQLCGGSYNTVINHGTAEHVFNIGQVFRTMHEYCAVGGLMIHESPFTGWIEHGFYSLQPGLFFDLAEVNHYDLVGMFIQDLHNQTVLQVNSREQIYQLAADEEIPANTMLLTVLRKTQPSPFVTPVQGVYRGALSPAGFEAWRSLR